MMGNNPREPAKKKHRTPALWMIIFIYFCFAVYGVMELFEAVALSFSDKGFMFTSFFFSIAFWTQPLLFALLGIAAVGIFKIQEWARLLSVVLAWAIIILRIIFWIDLMMREFVSLALEHVFAEALILTVVSAFFLFVYYYFNIPRIKKIFLRQAKQEKLKDILLRNNRKGFALLGLLLALLIILILFMFYFKRPGSCPISAGEATLTEYGINTSSYKAIGESVKDKIQQREAERLKAMEDLKQELR
jgi:hypothetical protein